MPVPAVFADEPPDHVRCPSAPDYTESFDDSERSMSCV
jgi:hypothetical protein